MTTNQTSILSPPVFNGENYSVWAVKMKAHLRGIGLWKWVTSEREIQSLGNNPMLNQIRMHEENYQKLQGHHLLYMLLSRNQFSQES